MIFFIFCVIKKFLLINLCIPACEKVCIQCLPQNWGIIRKIECEPKNLDFREKGNPNIRANPVSMFQPFLIKGRISNYSNLPCNQFCCLVVDTLAGNPYD
ncbi:MAG: hypothetical protein B6245_05890 [Desulfobacteraceae bacterium 4572_88]|nr:MAG: hypothetical protein B6245_05890 [Desulfobacteraceae bacterium 4572_88]